MSFKATNNENNSNDEIYQYETLEEDIPDDEEGDNDLTEALAKLHIKNKPSNHDKSMASTATITNIRPSVIDDYIRNFFIKAGLAKSLEAFNLEWYEMQSKGRLPADVIADVPDVYLHNDELDQQTKVLRDQLEKMKEVTSRAQATWDKFRKERDYHRMHHRRVIQEKNKLIDDLRRLKNHLKSYEPTIDELKRRYEKVITEKMLIKLERDRLQLRVKALEEQIVTLTNKKDESNALSTKRSATRPVRKQAIFPPDESIVNPFLDVDFDPPDLVNYQLRRSYKGHLNSISACAFHPKKPIFATGSDDEVWKIWTLNENDLVMSGEGHKSWISDIDFHPHGSHLVTSSGDNTIKIWEFQQARCNQTYNDHTQSVWGCKFHYTGDFVASCSMDHTIRIYDLIANKCRQTLRGHVDSVNGIFWQPYSANICSASGDKTLSVWDGRTGLCVQTLYGHTNSCNHVLVTNHGNTLISSDADGVVKVWDIRMVSELASIETGQYPVNKLSVDRGGHRLLGASDDGTIKVINLDDYSLITSLTGHDGPVQAVAFSPNDAFFVSGSSDCTYKVWGA